MCVYEQTRKTCYRSFKKEIKDEKIKKSMTKEFIDFYAKNIDKNSVPLKGSINFFNWAKKKKIFQWPFVRINKNDWPWIF